MWIYLGEVPCRHEHMEAHVRWRHHHVSVTTSGWTWTWRSGWSSSLSSSLVSTSSRCWWQVPPHRFVSSWCHLLRRCWPGTHLSARSGKHRLVFLYLFGEEENQLKNIISFYFSKMFVKAQIIYLKYKRKIFVYAILWFIEILWKLWKRMVGTKTAGRGNTKLRSRQYSCF